MSQTRNCHINPVVNWAKNGDGKKALIDFSVYDDFDCLFGSLKLS